MNQPTATLPQIDPTVLALARELAMAELHREALERAKRWSVVGLGLAAAIAGFIIGVYAATPVAAQTQGSYGPTAQATQLGSAPTREQLMALLPGEERARLQQFEQKVAWVSQYMRSSPQFDAGAAIALFLSDMAKAMEAVPKMQDEMQTMNTKMNALPFMANEVGGINAKMSVMTANMDATMGRMGRMMPWGW